MPVARLADRLEVAVGRDDDPVRADDRLEDHRGDGVRALVLEDLLEVRRARADRARIRMAGGAAVGVGVEHPHDARQPGLGVPAARVAGERDRAGRWRRGSCGSARSTLCRPVTQRATLIAFSFASAPPFVKNDIFRLPGVTSASIRAERRARLGRHRRPDRAELLGLLLDRRDHLRVPVADRDVDELRGEVEVALAVVVPEVAALGAGDRNRVDRALHRPGVEDELLRVRLDLRAELRVRLDRGHGSIVSS